VGGRPRRFAFRARLPPVSQAWTHVITVWRLTPNTRAASAFAIPFRTASTARDRNASWAAAGSERASAVLTAHV
jgi:hypothetical protein